ncbi:MAG: helix-turn-helix domain-containing protein [Eubacterium sp.]
MKSKGEITHYKRLKDLRVDKDLNQTELAKALQMSQENYSYIENGRAHLKAADLALICKFFNVSADYILELTDIPTELYKKNNKNKL